jgi:hypothetical protein
MTHRYPITLLPGIVGLLAGVVITTLGLGRSEVALAYAALPEYQVWRMGMIVQLSVYTSIAAYLLSASSFEASLPRPPAVDRWTVTAMTGLAVLLPNLIVQLGPFPLPGHQWRMLVVVATALLGIMLLTNRLARIHLAFAEADSVERHRALRAESKNLLRIAALVVTLATLGSAILHISLRSLEADLAGAYVAPLDRPHVVSYGAYFTLVLFLFFTPVLVADRSSAIRIREKVAPDRANTGAVEAELGLDVSLSERMASVFGVMSPLIGALLTQIVR